MPISTNLQDREFSKFVESPTRPGETAVEITGAIEVTTSGLTNSELRSDPINITGPVSVSNFPATQTITGNVTANTGLAQPLTDEQLRASSVAVNVGNFPASQAITGSINVSNFPATQNISGTVTANTGLAQPLTNAELRAGAVPVSLTSTSISNFPASQAVTGSVGVSNFPATQAVSATSLPLPTGAATETTLNNLSAKLPASLGSKAAATSLSTTTAIDGKLEHVSDVLSAGSGSTVISILDVTGFGGATVDCFISGTVTSGEIKIEVSIDGTNYYFTNVVNDTTLTGEPAFAPVPFVNGYQYKVNITGYKFLKVTLTNVVANVGSSAKVGIGASRGTPVIAAINGYVFTKDHKSEDIDLKLNTIQARTPALGQANMASSSPVVIASNQTSIPVAVSEATVLFKGRASTHNTPGRAGTTGQRILSLYNSAGSAVTLKVPKVLVDLAQTVAKALTVAPPIVRLYKVTVAPTNGTALVKNKIGGTSTSSASIVVLGDASADNTNSASALTATLPTGAILAQEYAPRYITAAGYEMADRIEFLNETSVTLLAGEGLVLSLDYTLATQNPTTDRWIAGIEWTES